MASYRILIRVSALKELEALPLKDRRRVAARIGAPGSAPRPTGGERLVGVDAHRLRQGNYRVVYTIDDAEKCVTVVRVAHRRDVYRS